MSSPTANFTYEYEDENTVQFTNLSYENIKAYEWTFENGRSKEKEPLHQFNSEGSHQVWLLVINNYDCRDRVMRNVHPPMYVYAPNAFSPNGDGLNDVFIFKGIGIKAFKVLIYNRWGELLFQTDEINNVWDGTYKGKKLQTGVYLYKVKAISYQDVAIEKAGKLNLLK